MKIGIKNGKIKTKSDAPKGLRAVECGCCGPCGGCPTILGALSATSLAWSADFGVRPEKPDCQDYGGYQGVIDAVSACSASTGFAFRCYMTVDYICADNGGCPGGFGSSVGAFLLFGKYKVETISGGECVTAPINVLVPDPSAGCAYWLTMGGSEAYGAFGWSVSSPKPLRIPIDNIMGTHAISCTVYAGEIEYYYDKATEQELSRRRCIDTISRSATITFS
jgi:hypothetical protein